MALIATICLLIDLVIIIGALSILFWTIGDNLFKLITEGYGLSDLLIDMFYSIKEIFNNGN